MLSVAVVFRWVFMLITKCEKRLTVCGISASLGEEPSGESDCCCSNLSEEMKIRIYQRFQSGCVFATFIELNKTYLKNKNKKHNRNDQYAEGSCHYP